MPFVYDEINVKYLYVVTQHFVSKVIIAVALHICTYQKSILSTIIVEKEAGHGNVREGVGVNLCIGPRYPVIY